MRIEFAFVILILCSGCGDQAPVPSAPVAPPAAELGPAAENDPLDQSKAAPAESAAPGSPAKAPVAAESELVEIETRLGFPLPESYRKFLLDHAGEIARKAAARKPGDYIGVFPYTAAARIIRENTGDKSFLVTIEGGQPVSFADKVVLIADNGGGDYTFVYRDPTLAGVWYWDNETSEIEKQAADLDEYFLKLP